MSKKSLPSPKLNALRLSGTLHPHPERVTDALFAQHDFFDPHDTLQVKYEMLRRVQIDHQSVRGTAAAFGCSRPTFYQAQAAFLAQGLAGLLPQKRGPHQAHKLGQEILSFVDQVRANEGPLSTPQLVERIRQKFDLVIHRRSLERALARRKKNAHSPPPLPRAPQPATKDLVAS